MVSKGSKQGSKGVGEPLSSGSLGVIPGVEESGYAPLPHEWMLVGIIGFFISVFFIYSLSKTWGLLFALFSIVLFVSSIVSMSADRLDEPFINELRIHEVEVRSGAHRRKKGRKSSKK